MTYNFSLKDALLYMCIYIVIFIWGIMNFIAFYDSTPPDYALWIFAKNDSTFEYVKCAVIPWFVCFVIWAIFRRRPSRKTSIPFTDSRKISIPFTDSRKISIPFTDSRKFSIPPADITRGVLYSASLGLYVSIFCLTFFHSATYRSQVVDILLYVFSNIFGLAIWAIFENDRNYTGILYYVDFTVSIIMWILVLSWIFICSYTECENMYAGS